MHCVMYYFVSLCQGETAMANWWSLNQQSIALIYNFIMVVVAMPIIPGTNSMRSIPVLNTGSPVIKLHHQVPR